MAIVCAIKGIEVIYVHFGFAHHSLIRIFALADPQNLASIRVM
jgi:RimJ/RimL family protein N-acetyltransferase